jgi:glycosyltransferase involved in cell wall biosynthesis
LQSKALTLSLFYQNPDKRFCMNAGNAVKIKLLIFIPSLECGGSEKYVSILCNNIDTQKFDVTLAVINNANPFYTITNAAIKVIDLKLSRVLYSFFKIRHIVKAFEPDIVFSTANHLNLYFAIFKNFLAPKTAVIARESSIVSINSKRAKLPFIYNGLIKKFYKRLNCIICQSQYMQQDLIGNYRIEKEKTAVINNAVEEEYLVNSEHQKNKFITVARLSEEKGIDRLIRSVAKLTIPFSYHIIGDGDRKEQLQNLINSLHLQDKVFLEGKKVNPFAGMEDAGLFLMGSHYEGLPNVLLEAGMLGLPVVAFDAPGGINEIIVDGENGLLVKDNDENSFAIAIEKAMAANFNRKQIITNTKSKFSASLIIKQTEELFTKLAGNCK